MHGTPVRPCRGLCEDRSRKHRRHNGLAWSLALLWVLGVLPSAHPLAAQSHDRVVVSLRVSVNVVPAVQTRSPQRGNKPLGKPQPLTSSSDATLHWLEGDSAYTSIEEVRDLCDTFWGSELLARRAGSVASTSSGRGSQESGVKGRNERSVALTAVGPFPALRNQARLVTRTFVAR